MIRVPRSLPPLLTAAVLLAGCVGVSGDLPSPSAEAVASAAASAAAATATPETTATATPAAEPTASEASAAPSAGTGGGFTVAANPEADALFLERDECMNPQDGYRLEFPEDWWTNTEIARFPSCVWFSPTFYEVVDETQRPDEIAIEIFWLAGDRGYFTEEISREDVEVGLQAAVRLEVEGTPDDPTSGSSYEYVIRLGPTPEEGPNLVARTDTDMGGDYELNKAVLDRLMATIEFIGTTQ